MKKIQIYKSMIGNKVRFLVECGWISNSLVEVDRLCQGQYTKRPCSHYDSNDESYVCCKFTIKKEKDFNKDKLITNLSHIQNNNDNPQDNVNKPTLPIQDLSQTLIKGSPTKESDLMNELQHRIKKNKTDSKKEQLRKHLFKE